MRAIPYLCSEFDWRVVSYQLGESPRMTGIVYENSNLSLLTLNGEGGLVGCKRLWIKNLNRLPAGVG